MFAVGDAFKPGSQGWCWYMYARLVSFHCFSLIGWVMFSGAWYCAPVIPGLKRMLRICRRWRCPPTEFQSVHVRYWSTHPHPPPQDLFVKCHCDSSWFLRGFFHKPFIILVSSLIIFRYNFFFFTCWYLNSSILWKHNILWMCIYHFWTWNYFWHSLILWILAQGHVAVAALWLDFVPGSWGTCAQAVRSHAVRSGRDGTRRSGKVAAPGIVTGNPP